MVNQPDSLRLLLVDDRLVVRPGVIPQKNLVGHVELPLGHAFPPAPLGVLGYGPALFLGQGGHDGDEEFPRGVQRFDALFLKLHLDALFLQLSNRGQAVHRVPGKPANGFCKNQVNLACQGVSYHLLEPFTVRRARTADALVGINPHEFPVRITFDVFRIIFHLHLITGLLFLQVCGDTRICRHLPGYLLSVRCCLKRVYRRRYRLHNKAHARTSFLYIACFFPPCVPASSTLSG